MVEDINGIQQQRGMNALTSLELPAVMGTEIFDNVGPDNEIFLIKMVDSKEEEDTKKSGTVRWMQKFQEWIQSLSKLCSANNFFSPPARPIFFCAFDYISTTTASIGKR